MKKMPKPMLQLILKKLQLSKTPRMIPKTLKQDNVDADAVAELDAEPDADVASHAATTSTTTTAITTKSTTATNTPRHVVTLVVVDVDAALAVVTEREREELLLRLNSGTHFDAILTGLVVVWCVNVMTLGR